MKAMAILNLKKKSLIWLFLLLICELYSKILSNILDVSSIENDSLDASSK